MIVGSVVKCCQQVVGFGETDGETRVDAQVEPSAEVARKSRASVGRSRICSLNQRPARMRKAQQHLSEGLKRSTLDGRQVAHSRRECAAREVIAGCGDRARMRDGDVPGQRKLPRTELLLK